MTTALPHDALPDQLAPREVLLTSPGLTTPLEAERLAARAAPGVDPADFRRERLVG